MNLVKFDRVPTKIEIGRLKSSMMTMPQCANFITDHFFVPGMYCRRLWRPAGAIIVGKVHKAPHFFLCAMGEIIAWSETGMRHMKPGDVIESMPGTERVTLALTDALGITVHKTNKTVLADIEEELLEPDETALFDSNNEVKSLLMQGKKGRVLL